MCRSIPVIRTALPGDEKRLSELIRLSFKDVALRFGLTPQNCPKHPSNCTAEWIRKDFSRGAAYFILETKRRAVGCVAFEPADLELGYLERLAVMPLFRRNGFGIRLVEHVFSRARERGVKRLSVGIIADQEELKNWYRRIGFVSGETRTFEHLPFAVTFMSCAI